MCRHWSGWIPWGFDMFCCSFLEMEEPRVIYKFTKHGSLYCDHFPAVQGQRKRWNGTQAVDDIHPTAPVHSVELLRTHIYLLKPFNWVVRFPCSGVVRPPGLFLGALHKVLAQHLLKDLRSATESLLAGLPLLIDLLVCWSSSITHRIHVWYIC